MINHRQKNRNLSLYLALGERLLDLQQMEMELISYFSNLLTEEYRDQEEAINQITGIIPSLISQEQNEALMRPVTK